MKLELEVADLVGAASAIDAASRAGLFNELLQRGPLSLAALSTALPAHPRGLAIVAEVLVSLGLLARSADGLLSVNAELHALDGRMPGAVMLAGALFAGAPDLLRSGTPVTVMDGGATDRSEAYRGAVTGLAGLFQQAAIEFAAAFGQAEGPVLDAGCGSGVWSLALAARQQGLEVTGLDLPGVIEVFAERAELAGLKGRARAWAADLHEVDLPKGEFGTVLLANVLRLEPTMRAQALVGRLAQAVRPGGRLVVIDALSSGNQAREVARAVYGLHLGLRTLSGTVHLPADVAAWMLACGLSDVHALEFGAHPGAVAALVGSRR